MSTFDILAACEQVVDFYQVGQLSLERITDWYPIGGQEVNICALCVELFPDITQIAFACHNFVQPLDLIICSRVDNTHL